MVDVQSFFKNKNNRIIVGIVLIMVIALLISTYEPTEEVEVPILEEIEEIMVEEEPEGEEELIWIPDTWNNRMQLFTSNGTFVFAFGERGNGDEGFRFPSDVAQVGKNLYVLDKGNSVVKKFDLNGTLLTSYGGLNNPVGMCISNGYIFVANTYKNNIVKMDMDGNLILTWGGRGRGKGQFMFPVDVACDEQDVFVVDTYNHRIQQFDVNGNFKGQWGRLGQIDTRFRFPYGIGLDENYVYVSDSQNHLVKRFGRNSYPDDVISWGGFGEGDGDFKFQDKIWIHDETLYVADSNNHRIQMFDTNGMFLGKFGAFGRDEGLLRVPGGKRVTRSSTFGLNVSKKATGNATNSSS